MLTQHIDYQRIFDALDVALVILDHQKQIIYLNEAFANYLQSSNKELLGKPINQFNPFLTLFKRNFLLQLKEKGEWKGEFYDQHRQCFFLRIKSIYDEKNNLLWYVASLDDITAEKKTETMINHLAYFDNLTGLANYYYFKKLLAGEIESSIYNSQKFALLLIDIDKFKLINDNYGHEFGDILLKKFAQRLKKNVRSTDIVARRGGDEFHIILKDIENLKYVRTFAQSVLAMMEEVFNIKKHQISITVSIGVVCFPKDANNLNELLIKADDAMYLSKNRGRNLFTVYYNSDHEIS